MTKVEYGINIGVYNISSIMKYFIFFQFCLIVLYIMKNNFASCMYYMCLYVNIHLWRYISVFVCVYFVCKCVCILTCEGESVCVYSTVKVYMCVFVWMSVSLLVKVKEVIWRSEVVTEMNFSNTSFCSPLRQNFSLNLYLSILASESRHQALGIFLFIATVAWKHIWFYGSSYIPKLGSYVCTAGNSLTVS